MVDPTDPAAAMDMLKAVPLFSSLNNKQLKALAKTATDQTYKPGDVLVAEGKQGVGFYLVAQGQVAVEKGGKTVASLGPGQFFGEMALIDEQPRSATVKAVGPTRCLVVTRWDFWGTVAKDPEVLRVLLRETVRRLREAKPGPED